MWKKNHIEEISTHSTWAKVEKKREYGKNKLDNSHDDASNQPVSQSVSWLDSLLVWVSIHSLMVIIIWFDISKQYDILIIIISARTSKT